MIDDRVAAVGNVVGGHRLARILDLIISAKHVQELRDAEGIRGGKHRKRSIGKRRLNHKNGRRRFRAFFFFGACNADRPDNVRNRASVAVPRAVLKGKAGRKREISSSGTRSGGGCTEMRYAAVAAGDRNVRLNHNWAVLNKKVAVRRVRVKKKPRVL